MSTELQKEAASLGALLEYTILSVTGGRGSLDVFAAQIREVGPENVVITSDLGQSGNPSHADGMRTIIQQLVAVGFSEAEIGLMVRSNPARLLGID
jgi:microsomal dipeptidase-like Zn-dependent dipeptidase